MYILPTAVHLIFVLGGSNSRVGDEKDMTSLVQNILKSNVLRLYSEKHELHNTYPTVLVIIVSGCVSAVLNVKDSIPGTVGISLRLAGHLLQMPLTRFSHTLDNPAATAVQLSHVGVHLRNCIRGL